MKVKCIAYALLWNIAICITSCGKNEVLAGWGKNRKNGGRYGGIHPNGHKGHTKNYYQHNKAQKERDSMKEGWKGMVQGRMGGMVGMGGKTDDTYGSSDGKLYLRHQNYKHMSDVRAPGCRATFHLLCLRGNELTRIDDYDFAPWEILDTLDLSGNKITEISKRAFQGTVLKTLNLEGNKLSCLPHLGAVGPTLYSLQAGYNNLGQCAADTNYEGELPKLGVLEFPGNGLLNLPSISFAAPSLNVMDLRNNSFSYVPSLESGFDNLKYLKLARNPLQCGCKAAWLKRLEKKGGHLYADEINCDINGPNGGRQWSDLELRDIESFCQNSNKPVAKPEVTWEQGPPSLFREVMTDGVVIDSHAPSSGKIIAQKSGSTDYEAEVEALANVGGTDSHQWFLDWDELNGSGRMANAPYILVLTIAGAISKAMFETVNF